MKVIDLKDAVGKELQEQAWELYVNSFPDHERWTKEAFMRAAGDERFNTKLLVDETGVLIALLYYWTYGEFLYVEFFAVNPAMRGRNVGSEIITTLIKENSGRRVLLEIDPPVDEISIRRLRFYERLGFVANGYEHIHPSYISGDGAHPHLLVVLTHKGVISANEFMEFRTFLLSVLEKYGD